MSACDDCLRRAWLLGRLSGHLDRVRGERRHIRGVLALTDADLIAALGGGDRHLITHEHGAFRSDALRSAMRRADVHGLCGHDQGFPPQLTDLPDVPAMLFVAGDPARFGLLARSPGDVPAVAVVGARRASSDALSVAGDLARDLAIAGITVVSGMAMGVDAAAHRGALLGDGPTIAVLGGGADVVYPRTERALYDALRTTEVIVSELPPGAIIRKWSFPARNRIIAALAGLTVVVEAAERSGSLITAELAGSLGRDVGAVPGRPTVTRTRGSNGLLRQGCAVIRDAQDVLDQLFGVGARVAGVPLADPASLEPGLRRTLEEVRAGHETVGALCSRPEDVAVVSARLGELEHLGHIRRTPAGRYVSAS